MPAGASMRLREFFSTGASARPSYLRRRRAKLVQHPLAQSFGIALAGLRETHDLPSQHVIGRSPRSASRRATRAISNARPMTRIVSGSGFSLSRWSRIAMARAGGLAGWTELMGTFSIFRLR